MMETMCFSLLPLSDPPPPPLKSAGFLWQQAVLCRNICEKTELHLTAIPVGIYEGQENNAKHLKEYSLMKQSSNRIFYEPKKESYDLGPLVSGRAHVGHGQE